MTWIELSFGHELNKIWLVAKWEECLLQRLFIRDERMSGSGKGRVRELCLADGLPLGCKVEKQLLIFFCEVLRDSVGGAQSLASIESELMLQAVGQSCARASWRHVMLGGTVRPNAGAVFFLAPVAGSLVAGLVKENAGHAADLGLLRMCGSWGGWVLGLGLGLARRERESWMAGAGCSGAGGLGWRRLLWRVPRAVGLWGGLVDDGQRDWGCGGLLRVSVADAGERTATRMSPSGRADVNGLDGWGSGGRSSWDSESEGLRMNGSSLREHTADEMGSTEWQFCVVLREECCASNIGNAPDVGATEVGMDEESVHGIGGRRTGVEERVSVAQSGGGDVGRCGACAVVVGPYCGVGVQPASLGEKIVGRTYDKLGLQAVKGQTWERICGGVHDRGVAEQSGAWVGVGGGGNLVGEGDNRYDDSIEDVGGGYKIQFPREHRRGLSGGLRTRAEMLVDIQMQAGIAVGVRVHIGVAASSYLYEGGDSWVIKEVECFLVGLVELKCLLRVSDGDGGGVLWPFYIGGGFTAFREMSGQDGTELHRRFSGAEEWTMLVGGVDCAFPAVGLSPVRGIWGEEEGVRWVGETKWGNGAGVFGEPEGGLGGEASLHGDWAGRIVQRVGVWIQYEAKLTHSVQGALGDG
ncbi:hypothetical protein DFH07DRAFT_782553 [Mycena maculata]|uniref:Uncharacterized protein n=1 Tax=Mycena maculata TaxID=230809 RepID=A0AAD7HTH5_9AGAR|nr:hypothetical protein DFH07DRAFT_782590 [Mycena maculata]KAJ7727128.1 hypothetical protein DFH07DRAFT_782553 [Mycena maculata]